MSDEARNSRPGLAGSGEPDVHTSQKGVFRKEGDYWTVGYREKSYRLKDAKGLAYIAHLLRHPDVSFHVLDLVGRIPAQAEKRENNQSAQGLPRGGEDLEKAGIHVGGLGDAGEMLDDQAKAAYRRRLSELHEELEEAKEVGNVARAEQAEAEIDALTRELSRAVGLSGRNRRAASASERARQSVTKTIKTVLERVARNDATLGDILSRCIKTGTYCTYSADPDFPIAWEFAAPIESSEERASSTEPAPSRVDHSEADASPVALAIPPFSLAERTAYVGREAEREAIRAAIERALNGDGSLVMLEGGAGLGKTRLAMEMADYAAQKGFQCFVGRCYERDEPFPYLPFVEIIESNLAQATNLDDFRRQLGDDAAELARLVPSLRRVFPIPEPLELPSTHKRRYLFRSVFETLARAALQRPQLNILDDLHWADESTLALLFYLASRVTQLPVVIIGTFRDGYSGNKPALARTLEELIRLGIRPLKLGGLPRGAVAQMLNALSRREAPENLVSAIFEESQGNPFFVEEVYRHLVEEGKVFDTTGEFRSGIQIDEIDVPESVRLVVGRRLERLDENERRVLAAAAVIGRSFSFQLLSPISHIDLDELLTVIEKAQQMGIVVSNSEGPETPFTFAHEIVRQTLLAGISSVRRQQLHASVADAIERFDPHAVDERAGENVDHLVHAKSFADPHKLVRWLTVVGKRELQLAAYEEARRTFQSALSHQDARDVRERAALLRDISDR